MLKRAVRSIIRSPGRSAVMVLMLFSLLFIVFICISAQPGIERGLSEAREILGNEVVLTTDFPRAQSDPDQVAGGIAASAVTERLAQTFMDSPCITDVNYYLWTPVTASFKPGTIQSENASISILPPDTILQKYSYILKGYSSLELQSDFKNGKFKLTDGKFPSPYAAEANPVPVVISRHLAARNGYKTGSTFVIEPEGSDYKQEMTVAGIFENAEPQSTSFQYALAINNIFAPLEAVKKIRHYSEPAVPEDVLASVSYFLDKPEHIDTFRQEAKTKGLDPDKYRLEANDTEYERITKPLQSFRTFSLVLMIAAVAVCTGILFIIAYRPYKKRKGEIGLLSSIGIGKRNICGQFIAEVLLVSFLALAMAGVMGAAFTQRLSNAMLSEQMKLSAWLDNNSKTVYPAGASYVAVSEKGSDIVVTGRGDSLIWSNAEVIDKIITTVGLRQALEFILAGLFPIICAGFAAGFCMVRHQPMEIVLPGMIRSQPEPGEKLFHGKVSNGQYSFTKCTEKGLNASGFSPVQQPPSLAVNEIIRVEDVTYGYNTKPEYVNAIRISSGAFCSGRIHAVTGQPAQAKSILLSLMAGLLLPDQGKIYFKGIETGTMAEKACRSGEIAIVLKACLTLPYLTALENTVLSFEPQGFSKNESKERAMKLLERAGFDLSKAGLQASLLNPFEQQAIAIVRALGPKPVVLLVDMPDWSACPQMEDSLLQLLIEAAHQDGVCVIMATDSRNQANLADEIWGIKDGVLLPIKTC